MDVTEDKLKDRDFVAGSFLTAADISLIFPMETAFEMDPAKEQKYPKCKAWLGRMYAREAHKRAMSKVGEVTK
jgi:glutathione S-transferase